MKLIKQIPNALTLMRIPLAFCFIFTFFRELSGGDNHIASLLIFALSSATDVADGMLARALNCVSDFGRLADPFADKLTQCVVLVCLCIEGVLPLWLILTYLIKEALMILTSLMLMCRGQTVVCSNLLGKASTVLFYIVTTFALAFTEFASVSVTFHVSCAAMTLVSVSAIASYYLQYRKHIKGLLTRKRGEADPTKTQ